VCVSNICVYVYNIQKTQIIQKGCTDCSISQEDPIFLERDSHFGDEPHSQGFSIIIKTDSLQTPGSPTLKQHIQTIWYTYHQRMSENTGYTQWFWL